jgi:hypothetical protein
MSLPSNTNKDVHAEEKVSYVGRYLKALVQNPNGTSHKKGDYFKIEKDPGTGSVSIEGQSGQRFGQKRYDWKKSEVELMPEGFEPDEILRENYTGRYLKMLVENAYCTGFKKDSYHKITSDNSKGNVVANNMGFGKGRYDWKSCEVELMPERFVPDILSVPVTPDKVFNDFTGRYLKVLNGHAKEHYPCPEGAYLKFDRISIDGYEHWGEEGGNQYHGLNVATRSDFKLMPEGFDPNVIVNPMSLTLKNDCCFKADSYIVLLSTCNGNDTEWEDDLPINHVYQLREDSNAFRFRVLIDKKGNTNNGWSVSLPNNSQNKLKLRLATDTERYFYMHKGGPCEVTQSTPFDIQGASIFAENADYVLSSNSNQELIWGKEKTVSLQSRKKKKRLTETVVKPKCINLKIK